MKSEEQRKLFRSLLMAGILLAILWLVKCCEVWFQVDWGRYGIYPQTWKGLRGVIFSPLLHADFSHLSANSVPLFVLTAALVYYYGKLSKWIFILSWLLTGFWVWIFTKGDGYHIGASGVVYALAAFHFTSGVLRREPRMMAFSLLVVFLYGGLVWGVFPEYFPGKNISWESHLLGLFVGVILAFFFRKEGPQRKQTYWDEEEDGDDDPDAYWKIPKEEKPEEPKQPPVFPPFVSDSTGSVRNNNS